MIDPHDEVFSVRDILDSQLQSSDERKIGRVADIEAEQCADGSLKLKYLVVGPQALARRVHPYVEAFFRFFLRDRFEHRIPISEVTKFGPTLYLRAKAEHYPVGQSERWIAKHILRWIPGSRL